MPYAPEAVIADRSLDGSTGFGVGLADGLGELLGTALWLPEGDALVLGSGVPQAPSARTERAATAANADLVERRTRKPYPDSMCATCQPARATPPSPILTTFPVALPEKLPW
ncbi:hypothetical protein GCM10028864_47900 [Microlunatus parietis]